jgi:hypothetical protein
MTAVTAPPVILPGPLLPPLAAGGTLLQLDPTTLLVDPSYQRGLFERFVTNQIMNNFQPEAFGQIVVGRRVDGTDWVVDGQQRRHAAIQLGHSLVSCQVFQSRGKQHEAQIYKIINANKKPMAPFDLWKARLTAQDSEALAIHNIATKYGLVIVDGSNTWNQVAAIRSLWYAYDRLDLSLFEEVLEVLTTAFHGQSGAVSEVMLKGMAKLYERYGTLIKKNDLISRLKKKSPPVIIREAEANQARTRASGHGFARYDFLMTALRDVYNRNRKKGRLD